MSWTVVVAIILIPVAMWVIRQISMPIERAILLHAPKLAFLTKEYGDKRHGT